MHSGWFEARKLLCAQTLVSQMGLSSAMSYREFLRDTFDDTSVDVVELASSMPIVFPESLLPTTASPVSATNRSPTVSLSSTRLLRTALFEFLARMIAPEAPVDGVDVTRLSSMVASDPSVTKIPQ